MKEQELRGNKKSVPIKNTNNRIRLELFVNFSPHEPDEQEEYTQA
jgi:hypothetical protein